MLAFIREQGSDRKRRLFGCACCRRTWHLLKDERGRLALDIIERYSDGLANEKELAQAVELAKQVHEETAGSAHEAAEKREDFVMVEQLSDEAEATDAIVSVAKMYIEAAAIATRCALMPGYAQFSHHGHSEPQAVVENVYHWEHEQQSILLRDIFGPLHFRSIFVDPAWLIWNDGIIPRLAQLIYDDRRFEDTPILADALLDAGCHDETLLAHCRTGGPHVRGCWVLDLILGKE
jgi:hypothetical protein